MSGYVIESGVPVPSEAGHVQYPFGDMDVGQSFWADLPRSRIQNAMKRAEQHFNHKYRGETRVRNGAIGCRVWRIE